MTATDSLIASLKSAVQSAPSDVPLRVHLATLLAAAGDHEGAVRHAAAALHSVPTDEQACALMVRLLSVHPAESSASALSAGPPVAVSATYTGAQTPGQTSRMPRELAHAARASQEAALHQEAADRPTAAAVATGEAVVSESRRRRREALARLADQLSTTPATPAPIDHGVLTIAPPDTAVIPAAHARDSASTSTPSALPTLDALHSDAPFVPLAASSPEVSVSALDPSARATTPGGAPEQPLIREVEPAPGVRGHAVNPSTGELWDAPPSWREEGAPARLPSPSGWGHPGDAGTPDVPAVTLADVGGLAEAKERIEALLIAPLRNPSLRRLYGRGLTGGVIYYGPPGAGKTYLARAIAGELGATFLLVDLADPRHSGYDLDTLAGDVLAQMPAVLCLQHIDALGGPGRNSRDTNLRSVNQLVSDLVGQDGRGAYVFATTDAPWAVDPSLRRHGRLERAIFVTPPDQQARVVILTRLLDRLGEDDVDVNDVALLTDGFSGHDLERLVRLADERRMRRREGRRRGPLLIDDLKASVPHLAASSGPWFERAKAEAKLHTDETVYAGLREYLKARGRW